MEHKREFVLSAATIVLAILAIVTFIYTGASGAFYVVIVVAIATGFVNAWLISRTEETRQAEPTRTTTRRKRAASR
jgi:fatty acid desaturase